RPGLPGRRGPGRAGAAGLTGPPPFPVAAPTAPGSAPPPLPAPCPPGKEAPAAAGRVKTARGARVAAAPRDRPDRRRASRFASARCSLPLFFGPALALGPGPRWWPAAVAAALRAGHRERADQCRWAP